MFKNYCKVCHKFMNHASTQDNFNINNIKKYFVIQEYHTRKRFKSIFQIKLLLQRVNNLK